MVLLHVYIRSGLIHPALTGTAVLVNSMCMLEPQGAYITMIACV